MSKTKFTFALDIDDTLMPCVSDACALCGIDPARITAYDLKKTDLSEQEINLMLTIFRSPEFVNSQKPFPGAVEMVNKLIADGHTVLIASAVDPDVMTSRASAIMRFFPNLPRENIMLGARKELLNVDFLLDDNPANLGGNAKYGVLFTAPHNKNVTGYLRADSYDEFLKMVEDVAASTPTPTIANISEIGRPGIICIVGPSGSGKSMISDELEKNPLFKKIRCITDRPMTEGEVNGDKYNFVSSDQFSKAVESGKLVENTTFRDGFNYGIAEKEINAIWSQGKIAIKAIDACGAKAIKEKYPDRALLLFVRREKEALLNSILESGTDTEDKVKKILTIDEASSNEAMCDYTVYNNGTPAHAIEQIMRMI